MLILEARELLGDEFANVSDETIQEMIRVFECIADLVIDQHLKERV